MDKWKDAAIAAGEKLLSEPESDTQHSATGVKTEDGTAMGDGEEINWPELWEWAYVEALRVKADTFTPEELEDFDATSELKVIEGKARPVAGTGPKLEDLLRFQSTGRPLPSSSAG